MGAHWQQMRRQRARGHPVSVSMPTHLEFSKGQVGLSSMQTWPGQRAARAGEPAFLTPPVGPPLEHRREKSATRSPRLGWDLENPGQ